MPQSRNFKISGEHVGQALATFLKHALKDKSWGEVKRLIAKRHVLVNGNLSIDPGRRLQKGESVEFWEHSRPRPPNETNVVIQYQDEHIVVIEKPAMITTLRHMDEEDWDEKRKSLQPTLTEALQKLIDRQNSAGSGPPTAVRSSEHPLHGKKVHKKPSLQRFVGKVPFRVVVRPVHRLDRDTSGLMIFALSPKAEQKLTDMFANHELERIYTAFVLGDVKDQTITTRILRDRGDGLRGSASKDLTDPGKIDPSARTATTHVKKIRNIGPYSQIECRLETGRTHQIRIHMSEIGHMLCGERTYNKTITGQHVRDPSGAPRQALHSGKLAFNHPITGKPLSFSMDLPGDLRDWLHTVEEKQRHAERLKAAQPEKPAD